MLRVLEQSAQKKDRQNRATAMLLIVLLPYFNAGTSAKHTQTVPIIFGYKDSLCALFTKSKKLHPDPKLYSNGHKIPIVNQVKFLGVIFDKKLTFLPHIKYVKRQMPQSTQPTKSCVRD